MSIFDPQPVRRVASSMENLQLAVNLPLSPLKSFIEQGSNSIRQTFGLGAVIRDFETPRGNTALLPPDPVVAGLRANPMTLPVLLSYKMIRGALGAQDSMKPLNQEDYKNSAYFRKDVPWDPGMTEDRAAALASAFDLKAAREHFGQMDPVMSIGTGILTGFMDPINYVPVFGVGARAAAAARFGYVAGHALIGASEAAINTAVFGALTTQNRGKYGDDVSWQSTINNIAFAGVAGAIFGAGGAAFGKFRSGRAAIKEATLKESITTIKNLEASRAALNDAVTSLATTGEVKLTPSSATTLERMSADVTDRRVTAGALDRETANVVGSKAGEVVIAPSGARVAVRPEVVDLSTLRRATGDLQVRDRSAGNAVSNAQVENIAINLDPARLMPNVDGSQGAPLVGADNVIDSGNGRVMALARSAESYPQKFAAYKQALVDAGYSVDGMETPVLIQRRTTDLSPDARSQFNAEVNSSTTARMSAVELAAMDRAALDDGVVSQLADGPVNSSDNRAFVSRFLANLPQNVRGDLLTPVGALNQDGVARVENALVAAAYGDVDAVALRKFAEATDDNTRAIVGAMSDSAGKWTQMRRAVKRGEIGPEFDQTTELTQALRKLSGWRERAAKEKRPVGIVIKEGMAQMDAFDGDMDLPTKLFVRAFYKSDDFGAAASRETIAGRLNDLANSALDLGQPDLLGDAYAATKLGVLKNAFGDDFSTALFEAQDLGTGTDGLGRPRGRRASGADGQAGAGRAGEGGRSRTITEADLSTVFPGIEDSKDFKLPGGVEMTLRHAENFYTGVGYAQINKWAREGKFPNVQDADKEMASAVIRRLMKDATPLAKDTVVYRGRLEKDNQAGFRSVTTDRAVAEGYANQPGSVVDEVTLPAGTLVHRVKGGPEKEIIVLPQVVDQVKEPTVADGLSPDATEPAFDLGLPPQRPAVDMQEPKPYPVTNDLAPAAARVGKAEDMKAMAEQYGVDPMTGDFVEQADIEQMRKEGRLTPEDEAALEAADQVYADAEAYADTLKVAASCMTA